MSDTIMFIMVLPFCKDSTRVVWSDAGQLQRPGN